MIDLGADDAMWVGGCKWRGSRIDGRRVDGLSLRCR